MLDFLSKLLDTSDFPARWHCGEWTRGHGWLHIISDTAIFAAYAAIPLSIVSYVIRKRQEVVFHRLYWLFALFIVSCGFGHLVEASIFWHPWYRLSGVVKAITAIASWATVVALVRALPAAVALPGTVQLVTKLETEMAERVRAEEEVRRLNRDLRHRAEELQTLFEVLPIGIAIASDPACGDIRVNHAFAQLLRMDPQANASLNPGTDDAPRHYKVLREGRELPSEELPLQVAAAQGKVVREVEEEVVFLNGDAFDMLGYAAPLFDSHGAVRGAVGAFLDITARKAAERRLRLSEERMRFAMEVVESGEWDLHLTDRTAPHRSLRHDLIFGYTELQPQWSYGEFLEHVLPEDRDRVDGLFSEALASRQDWDFECGIVRQDGVVRFIRAAGRHCPDESGQLNRLVGIVQDITARRQADEERLRVEKKLQETQKLESLGILAGGIAHDFNNLLTGVIGNASLARMEVTATSPMLPYLEQIEEAALRAADLCKQMLAYAGKGRFIIQDLDLSVLVQETTHLLHSSIGKSVVVKFNLAPELPAVSADATQMRQVVMNLVINAAEAVGSKSGLVSVSTGVVKADRAYLDGTVMAPELPEGEYVYLEVSDTGSGMSPQTLTRIFDPFFTTKFTGRGLGLAAVLGIVRAHRGALKVYSEVGKGTAFKILFPCAHRRPVPAELAAPPPEEWRGSGTVLVVDDEETVRVTTRRMLEATGFTVLTANDGREGVERFKAEQATICAVLLDLTMPRLDGEGTFRELRQLCPEVRVLLMSGFNEQEAINRFVGKGLAGFLQKPFKLESLQARMRAILA